LAEDAQKKRDEDAKQQKLAEDAQKKRDEDAKQQKLAEEAKKKRDEDAKQQKLVEDAQKKRDEELQRKEQQLAALEIQVRQQQLQVDQEHKRIEDTCHREEAKLADLKNAGASAREQLVKFETEAECKLLRPAITATLAALPANVPAKATPDQPAAPDIPVVKANQPEQIKQAQIELRRLGCFTGSPDGALMLNDKTRTAVKDFLGKAHKPLVEISITDEFIADLKQHSTDFCIPPKPVVKPAPMVERHKDNKETAVRPQVAPVQRVEKPSQTPPTPAKTPSFGVGMGI